MLMILYIYNIGQLAGHISVGIFIKCLFSK